METLLFLASRTLGMVVRLETWALTLFPPGDLLLHPLEAQHPARSDLARVDGIIAGQVDFRSGYRAGLRGIWRLDRSFLGINLAPKEYPGTFVCGVTGK